MGNKKLSIRILFPLIMSSVILFCVISCMMLSFHGLSKYFAREAVEEIGKQKDSLAQGLEKEIEEINELVNTIYYQNIKEHDFTDKEFSKSLNELVSDRNEYVHSIVLYDLTGKCIWSSEKGSEDAVEDEEWFVRTKNNIETIHFGTEKMVYHEELKHAFPVSRYIEYVEDGIMKSGVVCVRYYTDFVENIMESYENKKTGYCYLVDEKNQLIYHPFMRLIQSELYEEKTLEYVSEETEDLLVPYEYIQWIIGKQQIGYRGYIGYKGYPVKPYENDQWVIEKQQLGYTGWNVVVVNSLANIRVENINIYYVIWIALLLFGIVLIFFDVLLFYNFTSPIYQLINTMNEFGKGNYQEKAKEAGIGELKSLSQHFNQMADKLQKQMDEIRRNEREKQKMEKKLLQSQINPHFLYNTLDSIIWMIQSGEYEGAEQMVSLLAKFFRVSLSQGKDMISLKKELEHATSYLAIQNIRFKDKFEFCVNADESLMKYLCPKLSIQPLLENAIYHGMEGMYEDGEININVYEKDNEIHIDVVDNGLGMTEEKINYIMNNKVVSSKRGSGIGVRNVNERIKLIYGNQYGISITSELDEGTTATITIPKLEEIDDK